MIRRKLDRMRCIPLGEWFKCIESFFLSFSLGFVLAFLFALMTPSRAMAGDIAKEALTDQNSVMSQSSFISGKVAETENSVVIDGATFVTSGNDQPIVKVDADTKKKVILRNVKIISNNQVVSDLHDEHKGTAGIIAIDNSQSKSKVVVRNVRMVARNASVSSISEENGNCAGLVCSKSGHYDKTQSISATAVGRTNISAIQGARPDYRRVGTTMRYGTQRAAVSASSSRVSPVSTTQSIRPDYRKIPKAN